MMVRGVDAKGDGVVKRIEPSGVSGRQIVRRLASSELNHRNGVVAKADPGASRSANSRTDRLRLQPVQGAVGEEGPAASARLFCFAEIAERR
jgi:hypothetical protein